MNKSDYILRSLTKISHKRWEYFIVSRIIHRLDNLSVEFVAQQLVKRPDGSRALTNLFFPQLGLHLEIDEPFHAQNGEKDTIRERDIVSVAGHDIERNGILDKQGVERSLSDICADTDDFIKTIRDRRAKQVEVGGFVPWNFATRYLAQPIIERGYLDVKDNDTFRLHVEALKCFGFKGRGYQRGVWTIKDGSNDWVWFPRLYPHYIWINEMTDDGRQIYQRANSNEAREQNQRSLEKECALAERNVIVFAKAKDNLGCNLLRMLAPSGWTKGNPTRAFCNMISFEIVNLFVREDI